ncbi:MAG: hypothetical protein K0S55_1904 [Clostridia bacterium]|nr:hypothetical protein [Clostridia bacterium]
MINYCPFWKTLKKKNITSYSLIHKYNISNGTLYRMRKGRPISTTTIDQFCKILNCNVDEIIEFINDDVQNKVNPDEKREGEDTK